MNKHTTPILAAVQRMHADDDKHALCDPYNSLLRRKGDFQSPTQRNEAEQVLACYETTLALEDKS